MIADASDECMIVPRLMDREIVDTGNVWPELYAFHHRIEHLFVTGKVLSSGSTQIAWVCLRAPRIIKVHGICL